MSPRARGGHEYCLTDSVLAALMYGEDSVTLLKPIPMVVDTTTVVSNRDEVCMDEACDMLRFLRRALTWVADA